jgi:Mg-chelatase subunit ChlD
VDLLLSSGDQTVGMVWFNRSAGVSQELTRDVNGLHQAIDNVPFSRKGGTRIDSGLQLAVQVLGRSSRNADRVIIMLTDGAPNNPDRAKDDPKKPALDAADAKRAADAARQSGATIYAVGLGKVGKDYDEGVLLYIAGDPGRYFAAPEPKDLSAVFQ